MSAVTDRLEKAKRRYVDAHPRSAALASAAAEVLPGGNTRTVLHFDPFPFRVADATAQRLRDVDGHDYLDLLGNYTAGLLGHSPETIKRAIVGALDQGWTLGATHPTEVRFAELIAARFPGIEQVRFTNSGTEANLLALAAALHLTDRKDVLIFDGGYHGGVLSFGSHREVNVPHQFVSATYNDVASVERAFSRHQLAAVLVEPMLGSAGCLPATNEFLTALRQLCSDADTPLVFDEVMTSRLSVGGLQELTGVIPDFTTLGKYLAGGMSFGALGGSAEMMAVYDQNAVLANGKPPLGHAGTFNNNVLTMAAGVATLSEVLTPEILAATNARGDQLRTDLNAIFVDAELPMTVTGQGSLLNIHPTEGPVVTPTDAATGEEELRELFFFDALEAGFYLARRGFIALSLEVTDSDIEEFVAFVRQWVTTPLVDD